MTRKEEQVRKAMLHYLEGSIHPEELEVLNQVVENDPEARRDLAELMLQDALLTKVSDESEFFELDEPAPSSSSTTSFRTSRIMKITRRNPVCEPAMPTSTRRMAIAAAAILFTVSVALAVKQMQPAGHSEPVTTVMPIVPVAPLATPLPEEHPAEPPVKATVAAPTEPEPSPVKPKAPPPKPKTATAKKDVPETSKPSTTAPVPDGFLTVPPGKLPPSPSKPAPKLPPKAPPPPPQQK